MTKTRNLLVFSIAILCCSFVDAKPLRETGIAFTTFGVNDAGNVANVSPEGRLVIKGIFFPKSGIVLNRSFNKTVVNRSGKRQVFKNGFLKLFHPDLRAINPSATRDRRVFPKGRAKKNNIVTFRFFGIHIPR